MDVLACAQVWLALTVDLDRDGDVSFNMSVDIPPGDLQRGFFFHIDDFPVDQIVVRPRELLGGGAGALFMRSLRVWHGLVTRCCYLWQL